MNAQPQPVLEAPRHEFRRGGPADLDLVVAIARKAYADQTVDWDAAVTWASNLLANKDVACLIGHRTIGFMLVMRTLWDTQPRAFLLPLFSLPGHDLEPLAMIRSMALLARDAGCATLEASTETTSDVGLLLKRLGARERALYVLDLE